MNEPVGTTVMTDSSGNGNNGVVDPSASRAGRSTTGATGYNWAYRSPTAPPASPERVVQVPDNSALEPVNDDFTIEIRFRFTDKFGNMAQKGQAQTPGGQWKIQMPGGVPSCLFKGSAGQVATGALTAMDDGEWHTLTCVLNSTGVTMYVDGVYRNKKNGTVGTLDNTLPDDGRRQDRLRPDRRHLRLLHRASRLPQDHQGPEPAADGGDDVQLSVADLHLQRHRRAATLTATSRPMPGSTATAPPAPVRRRTTSTPQSGTYRVKLTVTDNRGGTDVVVRDITVEGVPVESHIAYVGSAVGIGSTGTPSVVIPGGCFSR